MKHIASKLALFLILIFSMVILSDAFLCEEAAAEESSECCLQCCPSHHLAPQVKQSFVENSLMALSAKPSPFFEDGSVLLVKAIFHPPKAFA